MIIGAELNWLQPNCCNWTKLNWTKNKFGRTYPKLVKCLIIRDGKGIMQWCRLCSVQRILTYFKKISSDKII